jgi:hypothetical protein
MTEKRLLNICPAIFVLLLLIPKTAVFAQIPTGAWRDHLPYNKAKRLAEAGGKIFCCTLDGGLFSYSRKDNSIKKYSKVTGLSDSVFQPLAGLRTFRA